MRLLERVFPRDHTNAYYDTRRGGLSGTMMQIAKHGIRIAGVSALVGLPFVTPQLALEEPFNLHDGDLIPDLAAIVGISVFAYSALVAMWWLANDARAYWVQTPHRRDPRG